MSEVVIVAAVAANGVIGRADGLPWRLSSDMKHFRALSLGRPVIMGRRTYQSIGRPLAERPTIVVSRDAGFAAAGVTVVPTLAAALAEAERVAAATGVGEIVIAGGAEVYRAALPLAHRLELTEVALSPDGDTRFPAVDPALWREVARVACPRGPKDEADMVFVTLRRRDG